MTRTEFFKTILGAPMVNSRWSWGAIRHDGTVFLCVWQNEMRVHDNSNYVKVLYMEGDKHERSPARNERRRHVDLVRQGAPCYLIMQVARDVNALPRAIESFDQNTVLVGGDIIELNGDLWIQIEGEKSVEEL
ncbi:MAG: hypothetical protein HZC13_02750 [Nitrospirae bacterium]|nr:hypothetical protein [Nitrospirota bacterium]MBI5097319.1 hypothetical protein [Nitrospirota bacterium]